PSPPRSRTTAPPRAGRPRGSRARPPCPRTRRASDGRRPPCPSGARSRRDRAPRRCPRITRCVSCPAMSSADNSTRSRFAGWTMPSDGGAINPPSVVTYATHLRPALSRFEAPGPEPAVDLPGRDGLPAASMTAPLLAPPEYGIAYPNVTQGASLDRDQLLHADAVVVGTGAGGATAAARLRDAGRDVLMLEEGGLHR